MNYPDAPKNNDLFHDVPTLKDALKASSRNAQKHVDTLSESQMLESTAEEITEMICEKFEAPLLSLDDAVTSKPKETRSKDFIVTQTIRFDGDHNLLRHRSYPSDDKQPIGSIIQDIKTEERSIVAVVHINKHAMNAQPFSAEELEAMFEYNTTRLPECVDRANMHAKEYNKNLPNHVRPAVEARKQRLENAKASGAN